MANPSPDLLPCPFCGGAARIESNRDWHRIYADHDEECVFDAESSDMMAPAMPDVHDQLIAAWNRRATPPSPSTAPEVPPFPEPLTLADVEYAANTPASWDPDYRRTWQQLQVAQATIRELRAYARQLRALASRPAEVDDEGLPPLPKGRYAWEHSGGVVYDEDEFRQGQRDAVAADRARRGGQP